MSDQHDTQSINEHYPPIMVRPVPFPLPPAFLHQLGYDRAVATLSSVTDGDDRQPRRFVGLWWDEQADQLGWSDGVRRGVGQLDRQVWLHAGRTLGQVGRVADRAPGAPGRRCSAFPPRRWLLVDRRSGAELRVGRRSWAGAK